MCASNGEFCAPVCTSKIAETRCFSGFLVRHRGLCKKMGINKRSIRKACKTYVSTLVDAGINLETIRKTVGHASSGVTLRNYTLESGKKGGKMHKKTSRKYLDEKKFMHIWIVISSRAFVRIKMVHFVHLCAPLKSLKPAVLAGF